MQSVRFQGVLKACHSPGLYWGSGKQGDSMSLFKGDVMEGRLFWTAVNLFLLQLSLIETHTLFLLDKGISEVFTAGVVFVCLFVFLRNISTG